MAQLFNVNTKDRCNVAPDQGGSAQGRHELAEKLGEIAYSEAKSYAWGRQDGEHGNRDHHAALEFASLYRDRVIRYHLGMLRMPFSLKEAYDAWSRGEGF